MTFKKKNFYPSVNQAKDLIPGFSLAFGRLEEHVVLNGMSDSLIRNYGRNIAHLALYFDRLPHEVSAEEVNAYLYRKMVHEGLSMSYVKQTIFGMKLWFKLFNMDDKALKLPMKKEKWTYRHQYQESETPQNLCPCCKKAEMKTIMNFYANGPPLQYLLKKLPETTAVF